MNHQLKLGVLVLGAGISCASLAQNYPTSGLLYHTTESSSLTHRCNLQGTELHCEMAQVFVRKELTAERVAKRKSDLLQTLSDSTKNPQEFKKVCDDFKGWSRDLKNFSEKKPTEKLPAEGVKNLEQLSSSKLSEMQRLFELYGDYCDRNSSVNRDRLVSHLLETEAMTCRVGSHTWKEVFVRSKGVEAMNVGKADSWVTKSTQPEGACGVVQLNRFEPEKSGNLTFWNYISRKAITNPGGMGALGVSCKDLDESVYQYSWKSKSVPFECRTVNFSVL